MHVHARVPMSSAENGERSLPRIQCTSLTWHRYSFPLGSSIEGCVCVAVFVLPASCIRELLTQKIVGSAAPPCPPFPLLPFFNNRTLWHIYHATRSFEARCTVRNFPGRHGQRGCRYQRRCRCSCTCIKLGSSTCLSNIRFTISKMGGDRKERRRKSCIAANTTTTAAAAAAAVCDDDDFSSSYLNDEQQGASIDVNQASDPYVRRIKVGCTTNYPFPPFSPSSSSAVLSSITCSGFSLLSLPRRLPH